MKENQEKLSPLEQMNKILSDKEAVIDAKLEQLKNYKNELADFENQLKEKVEEIKKAQLEIAAEKTAIQKAWDEIHTYEKNLESSMEEVLAEKVLLEQRSMSDLKKMLEEDDVICIDPKSELQEMRKTSKVSEEFDLNALRQSVGIDVPNFGTKEDEIDIGSKEECVNEEKHTIDVFQPFQEIIEKKFPKWTVLDKTEEMFCVQIANRKELRIFAKEDPLMEVHIVVFHKNASTDKTLYSTCVSIKRVAGDWDFVCEDKYYEWFLPFIKTTDPEIVLKNCNDFIKKNL